MSFDWWVLAAYSKWRPIYLLSYEFLKLDFLWVVQLYATCWTTTDLDEQQQILLNYNRPCWTTTDLVELQQTLLNYNRPCWTTTDLVELQLTLGRENCWEQIYQMCEKFARIVSRLQNCSHDIGIVKYLKKFSDCDIILCFLTAQVLFKNAKNSVEWKQKVYRRFRLWVAHLNVWCCHPYHRSLCYIHALPY